MVVCKFFLQGTCKFGDFCKFDHQINDNFSSYQNQSSTSILRQSHFGASQQPKPATNPSNVDTNTLVKSVVNDMTSAEKGGQWLLSCYAPYKEKPAFPGFEDQSFEELRLGYYEAVKNGTVEQYKQQVQLMLQDAIMKLKSLQSPSPDIVNLLKAIYNTPPSSQAGVFGTNTTATSSAFSNAPNTSALFSQQASGSSIFAQPNQNLFGKSTQPQNKFGGTSTNMFGGVNQNTSIFGGQTSSSLFGNTQPQTQSKSIFGQANSNFGAQGSGSIFGGQSQGTPASNNPVFGGNPPSAGSIFGGQQASAPLGFTVQQNTSSFGAQAQTNSNSMFSNQSRPFEQVNQSNQSAFGQTPPAPNIFGAAPNTQVNQTTFGLPSTVANLAQQNSANVFGPAVNQPQNQPFAATNKPSIFGQPNAFTQQQQQQFNSPFAQQTKGVLDAQSHSSSIFGNTQVIGSANQINSQVQQIDESLYSKLEELTEEEIKWFESDDINNDLRIPEKPPTYEMCFKT